MIGVTPAERSADGVWLGIECSGMTGSIAVAGGRWAQSLLAERPIRPQRRHNVELMPLVDATLRELGLGPADLTHVAVSVGPGSFTSLRVGVMTARGLGQALGCAVVGVPTLAALAEDAASRLSGAVTLATLLDAKRGRAFSQAYSASPGRPPMPMDPLAERPPLPWLMALPRPALAVGEGVLAHASALAEAGVEAISPPVARPGAASVLRWGARHLAEAGPSALADPLALEPIYLRQPEAEERWQERHGQPSS